jgi:serine/threonine protein phosphatase PrpC
VDVFDFDIEAADRFILCSDGVHGYLQSDDDLAALCTNRSMEQCAKDLVTWALERGGKDNATALVVDIAV